MPAPEKTFRCLVTWVKGQRQVQARVKKNNKKTQKSSNLINAGSSKQAKKNLNPKKYDQPTPLINTLVPQQLSSKSIDQTHHLLDTNLVSQLTYGGKHYAYIVFQFAAGSSALLFALASSAIFFLCSIAQSRAFLNARAPLEKESKLTSMRNLSNRAI